MLINKELVRIDKLFSKKRVSAYLPKDLSWLSIYKKTKLFQTASDIDLLVTKQDYRRCANILESYGWKLKRKNEEFSILTNYQWQERILTHPKIDLINIDLQWSAGKTHNGPFANPKQIISEEIVKDSLIRGGGIRTYSTWQKCPAYIRHSPFFLS